MLEEILSRFDAVHDMAIVRTVFGDPFQIEGRTLIPIAKVSYVGFGPGRSSETGEPEEKPGRRGESGTRVAVRPVALVEISGQKMRVMPIVDVTRPGCGGNAADDLERSVDHLHCPQGSYWPEDYYSTGGRDDDGSARED